MPDEQQSDLRPFIPAKLDDYGLSQAEFRIVCRIARRDICFESVESMATGCRMSLKTTRNALRSLVAREIIEVEKRDGDTSIYTLVPLNNWTENTPVKKRRATIIDRGSKNDRGSKTAHPTPIGMDTPTPTKREEATPTKIAPLRLSPEGNPSEGHPLKDVTGNPEQCAESLPDVHTTASKTPGAPSLLEWLEVAEEIRYYHIFGDDLEAVHSWLSFEGVGWILNAQGTEVENWRGLIRSCLKRTRGKLPSYQCNDVFNARYAISGVKGQLRIHEKFGGQMPFDLNRKLRELFEEWKAIVESAR